MLEAKPVELSDAFREGKRGSPGSQPQAHVNEAPPYAAPTCQSSPDPPCFRTQSGRSVHPKLSTHNRTLALSTVHVHAVSVLCVGFS